MADHSSSLQMTEKNLFTPERDKWEGQRERERELLSVPHNAKLKLMLTSSCFD